MNLPKDGLAVPSSFTVVSEDIWQNSKITNHLSLHRVQLPVEEGKFLVPHLELAHISKSLCCCGLHTALYRRDQAVASHFLVVGKKVFC